MKPDVLMLYPTRPGAMAQLEAAYRLHRYDLAPDEAARDAVLAEAGPVCRAIVTNGHAALTREMLARLPALEVVACSSAGYEAIDAAALAELGIPLTNTSDALYDDVADLTLLLILAARRELVRAHAYVASGEWGQKGMYPLLSAIRGRRLGLVGMGRIGQAIARRAEPFGFELAWWGRRPRPEIVWRHEPDLLALAGWADVLAIAIPGGPETLGVISRAVIEALGPRGTLVNIARGSVVDEEALIAALSDGRLGSAALDVFLNEPDPDPRLTALPNVTLYPHHASGTVETRDAMAQLVVDNLAAFYAGRPLLTPVA